MGGGGFFFLNVCEHFAHARVWRPWKFEGGFGSLGTRAIDNCGLPCEYCILCENRKFLRGHPSSPILSVNGWAYAG